MNYLAVLLKNKNSECFYLNTPLDEFTHKGFKFKKIENWVGLFYSYFTFRKEGSYFLAKIEYSFASKNVNISVLDIFENISYINFYKGNGEDPISIITINVNSSCPEKEINEEIMFSQWFGDDFLYKCDILDEYCFVFNLPNEIKVVNHGHVP